MDYALWKHQSDAVDRAKNDPIGFGFFMEVGTGKTATTIHTLRAKFNSQKRILKTLILCPPIVVNNWKDEWLKHSKIDPEKIVKLKGSAKQRFSAFSERKCDSIIFVTNYESLLMNELCRGIIEWKPEIFICDESHKLKDMRARRSKLCDAIANLNTPRPLVYLLSGTPILNTPMDVFMQFKILDGGTTFGDNFYAFRGKYFIDRNQNMPKQRHFPKWDIRTLQRDGFDAITELQSRVLRRAVYVKKSECLDLPPLVRKVIRVEMGSQQARLYKEMKQDLLTFLDDKAVVANMALTKALRLMQISSGFVMTEDEKTIAVPQVPKLEALKELLTELVPYHKVIVWAVWSENYKQIRAICESLGAEAVEVTGEVSASKKDDAVTRFNDDPNVRVLIGHPGSGGVGINLCSASYSIFYSRTFSLEHSLQAEARNYRSGSEIHEKITRIDLVCENTIDELVVRRLHEKQQIGESVLREIAEELKGGL